MLAICSRSARINVQICHIDVIACIWPRRIRQPEQTMQLSPAYQPIGLSEDYTGADSHLTDSPSTPRQQNQITNPDNHANSCA